MKPREIRGFDDLRNYLGSVTTWDGDDVHDFGGVFILLGALLDNLRTHVSDADLEIIGGYLSEHQKLFLRRIAELANRPEVD